MAAKTSREFFSSVIYSNLIESSFNAVKGMQHSEVRQVKGVPFVNERYTLVHAYKRAWIGSPGRASLYNTLLMSAMQVNDIKRVH